MFDLSILVVTLLSNKFISDLRFKNSSKEDLHFREHNTCSTALSSTYQFLHRCKNQTYESTCPLHQQQTWLHTLVPMKQIQLYMACYNSWPIQNWKQWSKLLVKVTTTKKLADKHATELTNLNPKTWRWTHQQ